MRNKTLLAIVFLASMIPSGVLAQADVKLVFVKNKEIYVGSPLEPDLQARQITSDGIAKALPAWSKDGSRIAFIKGGNGQQQLGNLVVLRSDGEVLKSVQIRGEEDMAGGMRFVEALEWLGQERIAVSGSANPSLTETTIVDLAGGEGESGIFDDGPGADFSPDGKHFAYNTGSPHFTPESEREPALSVDHVSVFPKRGTRVRFVGARRWSPDSRKLAVIVEYPATERRSAVVWQIDGSIHETALPEGDFEDLFWADGDLMVASGRELLRIVGQQAVESDLTQGSLTPLQQVRAERKRLLDMVSDHGGRDADFWCEGCVLTALPRKVSAGGN